MGLGKNDKLTGGPSMISTTATSFESVGTLSVLSAATSGPKWGFGGAPRFKWAEPKAKAKTVKLSASSPALLADVASPAKSASRTESKSSTGKRSKGTEQEQDKEDEPEASDPFEEDDGVQGDPAMVARMAHTDYGQYFGNCVTRFDGSSDRSLPTREHAAEPRAKSYQPARTIGESTAPILHHAPLWSFGGGKSRMADLEQTDVPVREKPKPQTADSKRALSLDNRKSKRKQMSRGFGSQVRCQVRGGPMEIQLRVTPGPANYNLAREGDKIPDWSASSRIPWGNRSATRPQMINYTASDVGPGEYTADHPFHVSRPTPKFGMAATDAPDSRKKYPGPKYDLGTTMGEGLKYGMGPGQRTKLGGETPSPGPVYNPTLKGVDPNPRAAPWGSYTSARAHPCDGVDPDDPPGPGTHNIGKVYKATDKPSTGLPRDEKQFRKIGGAGPEGLPSPGDYPLPQPRLGKPIALHLPIETPIRITPACTDYDPKIDYALFTKAPEPRPLHRTAPRKSIFDMSSGGSAGAAELLLQRALKATGGAGPKKEEEKPFGASSPKYSLAARRYTKNPMDDPKNQCQTMYGQVSSMG
mmetsp:Transcript_25359/g.45940  ORF Transcript_25359/g.45940 Transcript_25359/m.45940 type:complete len:585 (+) Transcript_25359:74-1828(+)